MAQRSVRHLRDICDVDKVSGIWKLKHDAVERVERVENNTTRAAQYKGPYTERMTPYMIKLTTEKKLRRVYATPIGNVSSMYFKVYSREVASGYIFCELALDEALHRPED